MLKEGDAAPDFVLKDADGNDVRLSALQGRPVVLYFYPRDNTMNCTIEAKSFRDWHKEFEEAGATVLGVSMDSAERHCGFRDKYELPFTLLSDPDGRVHDLYEAWYTSMLGKNSMAVRRITYVIDRDGIIRVTYGLVVPFGHAKSVLDQVHALNVAAASGPAR